MGRRKTCDLCTIKKIRCNAGVPACSYCTNYGVPCRWTPGIHKIARPKNRNLVAGPPPPSILVNTNVCTFADGVPLPSSSAASSDPLLNWMSEASDNPMPLSLKQCNPSEIEEVQAIETAGAKPLHLPAREDVEPVVRSFFLELNQFFPIFDPEKVVSMLHDWYRGSMSLRDEATWAILNIIIALGLQAKPGPRTAFSALRDSTVYVANAQSVLDKLVMWVDDCRGIQVLLGLVVYFQKALDRGPAQVLIASTIKLAFRLRLHTAQCSIGLPKKDIEERNRLFWAAYILDRDVSMRVRDPYILQDHDFDISPIRFVKIGGPNDEAAAFAEDGEFDYFRCRADLAFIQGKTHDLVNSVQAERLVDYQKWEKRESLWTMLNEWMSAIPEPYQPSHLDKLDGATEKAFVSLYVTRFRIICTIEKVFSHHTEWITRLMQFSAVWSAEEQASNKPTRDLLPDHWEDLVDSARTIMVLFRRVPRFCNGLLGNLCCAYCSALIVLVANKLVLPQNYQACQPDLDNALIIEGIEYMEAKYKVIAVPSLKSVSTACRELNRRAGTAVNVTSNNSYDTSSIKSSMEPAALETLIFEPCGSLQHSELQSAFIDSTWNMDPK